MGSNQWNWVSLGDIDRYNDLVNDTGKSKVIFRVYLLLHNIASEIIIAEDITGTNDSDISEIVKEATALAVERGYHPSRITFVRIRKENYTMFVC